MKVARRLASLLVLMLLSVFAVYGFVTARRELSLFMTDTVHDHHLLGESLATTAAAVWESEGIGRAIDLVSRGTQNELGLRWVSLVGDGPDPVDMRLSDFDRQELLGGREIHREIEDRGQPVMLSAFPILHDGTVQAAVVLHESLASRDAYVRTSVRNAALTTLALAALCSIVTLVLGITLVGRPVHALVAQARRIGKGDLGERLPVGKHDEIGELAAEMNAMCDQLVEAQKRVEHESLARVTAIEQLRHADRLTTVGKLASGIAHELGTPLNVVLGRAKMIRTRELSREAIQENARIIGDQAERMTAIIRQLLDFARARGPNKTRVDLGVLASQTAALLAPFASKRGVAIDVEARSGLPKVEVDPSQMQQVLTNLVLNAIHASSPDSAIRIAVSRDNRAPPADIGNEARDVLCVSVIDRGSGIASDVLPHIFEPFFTTKPVGEGTGLGLSVAYGIVREHDGWIDVETGELGTRFSVCLPIGRLE